MKKIAHILSAIDFSEPSLAALDRAGLIAREQSAGLILFHGMNAMLFKSWPRGFDPLMPELDSSIKNELRDKLAQLANQQHALGAHSVSSVLAESSGVEALVNTAKSHHADLVIAGAHGSGYWHELFLGSFISKLIAHNPVPTLVVKQSNPATYKKVLIPVDFSQSTDSLIRAATAIAPSAKKILLHVVQTPHEGLMRLRDSSKERVDQYRKSCIDHAQTKLDELIDSIQDGSFTGKVLHHGYPPGEIISFQRDQQCDLVVIGKHGANQLSDLLVGSVTKLVLSNVSCDTLVTVDGKSAK